jgi:hypothetical protein
LERKLNAQVKRMGGLALKFFPVSFTGMPDRIALLPGGRIWFIEIKTTGKKPRARQRIVHEMLSKLGFHVRVIDNIPSLEDVVEEMKHAIQAT